MNTSKDSSVCCPQFDPKTYDEKTIVWKDKLFMQDKVWQFVHIPINMSSVVTRMFKKIEEAGAASKTEDFLMLAYDPSPWVSEIYMTVTKEVPSANNVRLSGTFLCQVFDGPYNAVPKWLKKIDSFVASKGKRVLKYYFYYTTCPKCAKKYGHNYCVAFTQVENL